MYPVDDTIQQAAELFRSARHAIAFTGAGISVESGIPPFRGPDGLWSKYDPSLLDIDRFHRHPKDSWILIKEIFYDFFGKARPNVAHVALAEMEHEGLIQAVITQNIDNLHQDAGSRRVHEYHGTSRRLLCSQCDAKQDALQTAMEDLPPLCAACGGVLRPDFVFFGEPISQEVAAFSMQAAQTADLLLVIGTTGEIMPASMIPQTAKDHGARIVEINPNSSSFTHEITDIFIQQQATTAMTELWRKLQKEQ